MSLSHIKHGVLFVKLPKRPMQSVFTDKQGCIHATMRRPVDTTLP